MGPQDGVEQMDPLSYGCPSLCLIICLFLFLCIFLSVNAQDWWVQKAFNEETEQTKAKPGEWTAELFPELKLANIKIHFILKL